MEVSLATCRYDWLARLKSGSSGAREMGWSAAPTDSLVIGGTIRGAFSSRHFFHSRSHWRFYESVHYSTLIFESSHMALATRMKCQDGVYEDVRPALTVAEVHDIETDEVLRVTFACYDSQNSAWFGQVSGVRKYDLSDEDYRRLLEPVPDEQVYPLVPPGLTIHDPRNLDDYQIKRGNLIGFDDADVAKLLPEILLEEAKTLEYLKSRHHPNLIKYYGCLLKADRIAGLVLKRYHKMLQQQSEYDAIDFNVTKFMTGLRDGIHHLHSLGLAHNDLSPANIAVDEDDRPIILACRKFGEELISAGTSGWFDEESLDWALSAKAHDEFCSSEN